MATVQLKNITKHYGTKRKPETLVLKGIDVEIQSGEFIVVVGPSGCGKSTFLRVLAGLEEASSGHIMIDNIDVTHLEPSKRNIAMVFQNYALYPHMTVRENMAYGVKLAKMPADEIERRVFDTAKMLDIEAHLDKKPHALSGGQRQRVAMGRAIVRKPKLFLFDEPLSNLDAKLRTSTRLEIRKRHNEIGITTLYVTHDQTEAMTLADRIIILNAGKIEQFATPSEIFHAPASTFVANFMGSPAMNLLTVSLDERGVILNGVVLKGITVPASILQRNQQTFIIGIRPEHMRVRSHDEFDHMRDNELHNGNLATLTLSETLGSEQLLYCDLFGEMLTVKVADSKDRSGQYFAGDQLFIKFSPNELLWFDKTTGKAIE